jgi:hypothetical protein
VGRDQGVKWGVTDIKSIDPRRGRSSGSLILERPTKGEDHSVILLGSTRGVAVNGFKPARARAQSPQSRQS